MIAGSSCFFLSTRCANIVHEMGCRHMPEGPKRGRNKAINPAIVVLVAADRYR